MQKRHPLCFQFDRSNRTSGHLLRSITAKATDNSGNAASNTTSSAPIQLTVTAGVAQVYYIHTDQLNTPRLITNAANAKVWEWNNDDPFANNPVNDDPNATGNHFTYNPRLPGQYFDSETNTHYNYYRDYDPSTGRYIESDPIGLAGGINGYAYVNGSPVNSIDPKGLKTYRCTKPLNALKEKFGDKTAKYAQEYAPAAYHQYSCVVDKKTGKTECGGQDHKGSPLYGDGKPSEDTMGAGDCEETEPDNSCFESCLKDEWAKPRPKYGIPFGTDCQEYDEDVNKSCQKKCNIQR